MGIKQGGIAAMLAASVLVLSGCDGVGDGSAPDPNSVEDFEKIGGTGQLGTDTRYTAYTCLPETLQFGISYTNGGGRENFANRAKWTSSNESVLRVTNVGDRAFPVANDPETGQPLYFQVGGRLIPLKEGKAFIEADFKGIKLRKEYTVKNPQNIKVQAIGAFDPTAKSITLAHSTLQNALVSGEVDGTEIDLGFALDKWAFDTADETVAKLEAASLIGVNIRTLEKTTAAGGALRLRPVMQICPKDNADLLVQAAYDALVKDAYLDVAVAAATGLVVQREFDTMANGNVFAVVDTTKSKTGLSSEVLRVWAAFDAAGTQPEQDVSGLSALASLQSFLYVKSSNPDVILPGSAGKPSGLLALNTAKPETGVTPPDTSAPVTVDLCLSAAPPPDDPATPDVNESTTAPIVCRTNAQATPLTYTVQKKTLLSIDVTPGPGQQTLAALKTLQFRATGTYSDGSQQDLTRHVNWTSSQPLKAPIVNGVIAGAGLLRSLYVDNVDETSSTPSLEQRTIKVTAEIDTATVTKTREVTVILDK